MNELANLWTRLRALTRLVNELRERIVALEARISGLEQSQNQRWFQQ